MALRDHSKHTNVNQHDYLIGAFKTYIFGEFESPMVRSRVVLHVSRLT